jgi:hypothetical protein
MYIIAGMAELVDAHDSKSCFARSEGSSPSPGTKTPEPESTLSVIGVFCRIGTRKRAPGPREYSGRREQGRQAFPDTESAVDHACTE